MAKRKEGSGLLSPAVKGALAALAARAALERFIEARAMKALKGMLGRDEAELVLASFRRERDRLRGDGRKARGVMRLHLGVARRGLALYRALVLGLGNGEEAVNAAHRVMWEAFLKAPSTAIGYLLGRSRDPFASFTRGAGRANARLFPSPDWQRTEVELDGGTGFDYSGCFYYDYLREMEAPELTPAFCDMDVRQAECFPASIEFVREETLPAGDGLCSFRYYRRG